MKINKETKFWIINIIINTLLIIAIVIARIQHTSQIKHLEYINGKLIKDIQNYNYRIKGLEDRQDVRFLRMNREATFYKGSDIEVWKMIQK